MIAVAHPDLFALVLEPTVQKIQFFAFGNNISPAEFCGLVSALNLAAQHLHHGLLAIADPQYRNSQIENGARRHRRAFVEDGARSTGENHRLGRKLGQKGIGDVLIGMDFAVDFQLTQTPGD